MRDPYEVLGVSRGADAAEIKAAFRRLAAQHHPDRNPDDPKAQARFTELNTAHQILSDDQKRAAYDRYGAAAFAPGGAAAGARGPDFGDLGAMGFDGLFGDLLGAFGIRTGERGDLRHHLSIDFVESIEGVTREISYQRVDLCARCSGQGAEPGTETERCGACAGRGKIRFQQGFLPISAERICSRCHGTGSVPRTPCTVCKGSGLAKVERRLEVTLPAGIESGSSRLVEGGGSRPAPHLPAGALEIVVEVRPHPFFRREGDDLLCTVPISFPDAALGGTVQVPAIRGTLEVRVPPGTQPGSVLRLKGKGAPHRVRTGRGDQLVEVRVEVPTTLSPRARELIGELGAELGREVPAEDAGFFDKLKSLFE